MTNKEELAARLDALEAEAKAIRAKLEAPEVDPSTWIGKWGFVSDFDTACSDKGQLIRLIEYRPNAEYRFVSEPDTAWKCFRPATPQELGFPDPFEPDWSTAPEWAHHWAVDLDGKRCWFRLEPTQGDCDWIDSDGMYELASITNWRDSLRKRPVAEADTDNQC